MKRRHIFSILLLTLLSAVCACAQSNKEYILEDLNRSGAYFYHYEVPEIQTGIQTHPEGYEAFYISHFGRHGCRWHTSAEIYDRVTAILEDADKENLLQKTGKRFLKDMRVLKADISGRAGDLTPRGTAEHKGIAARMYGNYPEVFRPGAKINTRSTPIVRCVLSMAAFDEALKEKEPELEITRTSSHRDCAYFWGSLNDNYGKEKTALEDSLRKAWVDTDRFLKTVFKDKGACLKDKYAYPELFMYHCFEIASITQCSDYLGMDLYYLFNEDEIYALWKCLNAHAYLSMGNAYKYGDKTVENAKPLLRRIISDAEEVINGKSKDAATLRFGHDSNIIPLVALIGVEEAASRVPVEIADEHWNISEISCMATNLQLIFFRNKAGNIKVRVLFKEKDAGLPLEGGPFYDWNVLKAYLQSRLDRSYFYRSVDVEEFLEAAADQNVTMVDVRTPEEHAEGYIPGTSLNLNVMDSNFTAEALKQLKAGSTVAIYCRSGRRSKAAAEKLCANGFKVIELSTGFNGWTAAQEK